MRRRQFMQTALLGAALGGAGAAPARANSAAEYDSMVAPSPLPPGLQPREVMLDRGLPAFEIHVDPAAFALFWTLGNRRAIRYAVGVGKPGLYESGAFYVGAKKTWPDWTPTDAMIERDPDAYAQYADGMPGGPGNPLGARALYLFQPERGDTFLRIHGTGKPETIGRRVSNGCARLTNDQIIDLYDRVPLDTRVVLYPPRREA